MADRKEAGSSMDRIAVFGGYGAVGRAAAAALVRLLPEAQITVVGRHPDRARPVPGTTAVRADVTTAADRDRVLRDTDTVLMCAEADNVGVARACLERGIHYLDICADHRLLARIEGFDGLARDHGARAVLSVGLAPGVTNLLAAYCVGRSTVSEVRIGVLLGAGEQHGPAAVRWTLDGLGRLEGTWRMRFPAPHGNRTVHRFPFPDQYTLRRTLGVRRAETGLCLDSRAATGVLAAARWPGVSGVLRRPKVGDVLVSALARTRVGGDGFAVSVRSGAVRAGVSGRGQSRATGLMAALLVSRLAASAPGVRHVEQVVDPAEFLTALADHGFLLDLAA